MQNQFYILEQELSNMQERQGQNITGLLAICIFLLTPILAIIYGICYSEYYTQDQLGNQFGISLLAGGILAGIMGQYGYKIDIFIVKKVINSLLIKNRYFIEEIDKIDSVNSILLKSKSIYFTLNFFNFYMNTIRYLGGIADIHYQNVIAFENSFMHKILTDLRSDLTIRLTEQQKILESAKSEVGEHIQGTTELNQVSELQKARLDKQIEQFEELQRVLVKV